MHYDYIIFTNIAQWSNKTPKNIHNYDIFQLLLQQNASGYLEFHSCNASHTSYELATIGKFTSKGEIYIKGKLNAKQKANLPSEQPSHTRDREFSSILGNSE